MLSLRLAEVLDRNHHSRSISQHCWLSQNYTSLPAIICTDLGILYQPLMCQLNHYRTETPT